MANSKSRSTHSLVNNPTATLGNSSSMNGIGGAGGGMGNNNNSNNEQGFYQNLSVYRAQNQSQPILTER